MNILIYFAIIFLVWWFIFYLLHNQVYFIYAFMFVFKVFVKKRQKKPNETKQ